jgi:hypothetical protein
VFVLHPFEKKRRVEKLNCLMEEEKIASSGIIKKRRLMIIRIK